jgi:hypothetical protein
MKLDIVQITLKSVLVIENGTIEENVAGASALSVTLVAPNHLKPSVTSVKSVKLADNVEKKLDNEPFEDKILFKELIVGDCMVKVEITATEKVSKVANFVKKAFPTVLGVAIEAIPGIGSIVSSVVGAITKSIFDSEDKAEKLTVIGRASMPLSAASPTGDLILNLAVPKTIILNSRPKIDAEGNQIVKKITMKEGFVNAKVVLNVKNISVGEDLEPALLVQG